jgi:hypothetical protein
MNRTIPQPKKANLAGTVIKILAALVAIVFVPYASLELLKPSRGYYLGNFWGLDAWVTLLIGVLSGVYALSGRTPWPFSHRIFPRASRLGIVVRTMATAGGIFALMLAYVALFLGGSWQLCVFFSSWGMILGIFAVTGWNPLNTIRAALRNRSQNESKDEP